MPTSIGDAYSTHRMLYEAMRIDFAKGINPPECWFAKVVEAAEAEAAAKNKSATDWSQILAGTSQHELAGDQTDGSQSRHQSASTIEGYHAITGFMTEQIWTAKNGQE